MDLSKLLSLSHPNPEVGFIAGLLLCLSVRPLKPWPLCLSACRRELTYFGVKVAVIEPGYFSTNVTNPEKISRGFQETWDRLSPEVREAYGEEFLASGE